MEFKDFPGFPWFAWTLAPLNKQKMTWTWKKGEYMLAKIDKNFENCKKLLRWWQMVNEMRDWCQNSCDAPIFAEKASVLRTWIKRIQVYILLREFVNQPEAWFASWSIRDPWSSSSVKWKPQDASAFRKLLRETGSCYPLLRGPLQFQ